MQLEQLASRLTSARWQSTRDLDVRGAAVAAGVIAETDRLLAAQVNAAERSEAEALLAEHARTLNVRQLQTAAQHLRNHLDPDRGARLKDE